MDSPQPSAHSPRYDAQLGRVYRAEELSYVAVFFVGGRAGAVELLVGASDPPAYVAAALSAGADINSYGGAVVRPGEYWMARPRKPRALGYRCVVTPFGLPVSTGP